MRPCASILAVATLFAAAAASPSPVAAADPAPAAAPSLPPVQTVVSQLQAYYDGITTFQSDFRQTYVVRAYNTTKVSEGHVIFAKPGKMDWSYSNPAGNRVVSDGTTLRVFESANKQLFEQAVNTSQYPTALSFLTGQGQLATSFDFQIADGAGQFNFPGGYVLVGTPKSPTPAYQKVLFYVDKQQMQIRAVLIVDGQGNKNRFEFVSPVVNQPVNPNQFVFIAPPDTTVIKP